MSAIDRTALDRPTLNRTALDRVLPEPMLAERHHIDVAAPPAHVWRHVRQLDLARIPWVRMLFALRTLPERLAGKHQSHQPLHIRIDDLVSSPAAPGFQVLSDDPPHEITVGAIGKVWRPAIPFVHVDGAEAFAAFCERGFVKVAWAIRVVPRTSEPMPEWMPASASRVEFEVRVSANDAASWRLFERYFRIIGPASRLIRRAALMQLAREAEGAAHSEGRELTHLAEHLDGGLPLATMDDVAEGLAGAAIMALALMTPFLRRAREHWGLDAREAQRIYPGDELVPNPRWLWTHAVEIDAPASAVWPWVAQIGADRGGFYSYQWLENLAGCEIQNAETIHADWELVEGDELVLHPKTPPLRIVSVDRERHVLAYGAADDDARAAGRSWAEVSWLFFIEPLDRHRCRFVSRFRSTCSNDVATWLAFGPLFCEPVGFAMDRRMLLNVKARGEQSWRASRFGRSGPT